MAEVHTKQKMGKKGKERINAKETYKKLKRH